MNKTKREKICCLLIIILLLSLTFAACTPAKESAEENGQSIPDPADEKEDPQGHEDEKGDSPAHQTGSILEEMYRKYDDVPEVLRLDVSIPKVREDLPEAEEINDRISLDFKVAISAERNDYDGLIMGFAYPAYEVNYQEFAFDGIYEICVFSETYSTYGSGMDQWINRYYYDFNNKRAISEEEFLAHFGYDEDKIVEEFHKKFAGALDTGDYSYEMITYWYYFDENGELIFSPAIYS